MSYEDKLRGSGRTTRLVAYYVKRLLENPGKVITILDHHDTIESHMKLRDDVIYFLLSLDVDYLAIQHNQIKVIPIKKDV